jgi:hypothetical protein
MTAYLLLYFANYDIGKFMNEMLANIVLFFLAVEKGIDFFFLCLFIIIVFIVVLWFSMRCSINFIKKIKDEKTEEMKND